MFRTVEKKSIGTAPPSHDPPPPRLTLVPRPAVAKTKDVFERPEPPPDGDPNAGTETALQKHVEFFDFNGDGIITLQETIEGLRRLGVGLVPAIGFAAFINGVLGKRTQGHFTFDVSIANIHLGKHGSDSGVFDERGRFVPEKFERMFDVFDTDHNGKLSLTELVNMIHANKAPGDTAGNFGSKAEFGLLLFVAGQKDPATGAWSMSRDQVRQLYNGSLFYELEKQVAKGQGPSMGWLDIFRELRALAAS